MMKYIHFHENNNMKSIFLILKKYRCRYVHVKHSNSLNIDFSTTLGNPYAPLRYIKTINHHVSPAVIDILRCKRMFYFGDFNHIIHLNKYIHDFGTLIFRWFI